MSDENRIRSGNVVGKLSQEMDECVVVWKISNFTKKLSDPPDTYYDSPDFAFSDRYWVLTIYPSGDRREYTKGYTGLYLLLKGKHGCAISYTLSIRNAKGDAEFSHNLEYKFDSLKYNWGKINFCEKSTLMDRKSELLPDDTLTVECRLERKNSSFLGGKAKMADAAMQGIGDAAELEDLVTLRDEFEEMYQTGEFCDFDVKVQDRIFRTHRVVLAARSPALASMLSQDMKEKKTGMVEIVDCDSDSFADFLKFLYSGKYDVIVPKNVISLYEVANKYQVLNLKAKCLDFMMDNLSVELFCGVMCLALKHDERKLIKRATKYMKRNKKSIFLSVEWQIFFRENPTHANELLIKTCD